MLTINSSLDYLLSKANIVLIFRTVKNTLSIRISQISKPPLADATEPRETCSRIVTIHASFSLIVSYAFP